MRIPKTQSFNQSSLKKNNIGLVFDELKRSKRVVRSELAHKLHLSFATISGICEILKHKGFVAFGEEEASTGGRKPKSVEFLPQSHVILALDFSVKHTLHVSLVDLDYVTIADSWIKITAPNSCEELFEAMLESLGQLLETHGLDRGAIIGVGASVPGLYDEKLDRINFCTNPLLGCISIRKRLEELLELPVVVMNDANLAALGQCTLLQRPDANFFLLYFTEGIGLGIIHNGMSYPGSSGYAGEIGNIQVPIAGERVKVEKYLNMNGMLASYRYYLEHGVLAPPGAIELLDDAETWRLLDKLIEGCNRKDVTERNYIKEIGQLLGWLVTSLLDILNPGAIYIGGDIDPIVNYLLPHIRLHVRRNSILSTVTDVPIQPASVVDLIVKGTGELVYRRWLYATFFN